MNTTCLIGLSVVGVPGPLATGLAGCPFFPPDVGVGTPDALCEAPRGQNCHAANRMPTNRAAANARRRAICWRVGRRWRCTGRRIMPSDWRRIRPGSLPLAQPLQEVGKPSDVLGKRGVARAVAQLVRVGSEVVQLAL